MVPVRAVSLHVMRIAAPDRLAGEHAARGLRTRALERPDETVSFSERFGDVVLDLAVVVASFHETAATLRWFIDAEAEAAGVPLERCVIGGFSQGGYLALALAGQPGRARYAGVWAMCCGLPPFPDTPFDLAPGDGQTALVQFGTRDPFIANTDTEAAAAALREGGWQVRLEGYDMAHSQTLEMMTHAKEWLATIN